MTELWGITGSGNIYFLTTEERQWHRIESQGGLVPGFKKVSACSHSLWGLSCDQQLYVYVFPSDVPIRCQEETYENEVIQLCYNILKKNLVILIVPINTM